jgi:hypothetical protein
MTTGYQQSDIARLAEERDEARAVARCLADALREVASASSDRERIKAAEDVLGEIEVHPWLWEEKR